MALLLIILHKEGSALLNNLFYDLLAWLGYTHPFHPVLVHVPAGMSIGAFCFAVWANVTGQHIYRTTAYQLIVFAFLFIFLTIPVGILDWQRFYGGAWIFEIKMKLGLAALYVILLLATVVIGRNDTNSSIIMPALYASGLFTVMGLGFFGGQLVYHGFSPEAPEQFKVGRRTFESHCSGCHRRGENIIEPDLPLRNAPQLKNYNDFLSFVRDPHMPDGTPGAMPQYTPSVLSDEEARQLYDYLYFAFLTQKKRQ